jgi:hypothetical protein
MKPRKNFLLVIPLLLFLGVLSAATAAMHQWTDENGVVHFGNLGPEDDAEDVVEMKEMEYKGPSKNATRGTTKKTNRNQATSTSSKASAAEETKKMCEEAVSQAYDTIETMLSTAKSNYAGGHLEKSKYEELRKSLLAIKNELSVSDCMRSSGKNKKLYECLAKTYGDIASCGEKYR